MKKITGFLLIAICISIALFNSCKKDICENYTDNLLPVANAGYDQTIILPTDSVYLNADSSTDPHGAIVTYQWTKISGPDSITIANTTAAQTWITHLEEGYYFIELKVTDSA